MLRWRTILGVLLAMSICELALHFLKDGHPAPGARVVQRVIEGNGVSQWNADGSRRNPSWRAGLPRVLVVGDSFTAAVEVGDGEVYTARLRGFDAINVGRSWQSPADYVLLAEEYRLRFEPAWTVVQLGVSDLAGDAFDRSKTHFDAALNVVALPRPRASHVRDWSAALDYGITRAGMWLRQDAVSQTPCATPPFPVAAELDRLADAYNGRITLLFLPEFNDCVSGVEREFTEHCARAGLSCVNLRETFAQFRARGDAPYGFANSRFGYGHLNARGHAAVARLLTRELTLRKVSAE